ncbi:MAG: hypothetical protein ABRQ34_04930, partial [Smithellaceae bacterium]
DRNGNTGAGIIVVKDACRINAGSVSSKINANISGLLRAHHGKKNKQMDLVNFVQRDNFFYRL